MYNTDQTLIDRFNNNIQTEANNNDPRPLVYITRNKTAITSQRYWEKTLITSTVGTRSSIAVRRPLGAFMGDMIFTAQVEDGTAYIRYAERKINLEDMVFTDLTFIPNVSELSIMFDGFMKQSSDEVVETYTVGNLPYVFYVDTSNSLKYINLDDETIFGTISDDAVNVATVRGLYAESIGMDDGIFCFYTNTLGELWESSILDGEVVELTQITKKPEGVTAWVDVWAGFTFDYRIVLQLKSEGTVSETEISYGGNLIPQMTNNTLPSGVASASTEFNSEYGAHKSMDGNATTYWSNASGSLPAWLSYEFTSAQKIGKYSITARSDASDGAPKSWTLEAFNGSQWVVLDTRINETFSNGQEKEYVFANTIEYLKYRLNITQNNGRVTTNVASFKLIEVIITTVESGGESKVYTLVSKSRPSGYSKLEYLALTKVEVSGQCGMEPPNLVSIETVGVS